MNVSEVSHFSKGPSLDSDIDTDILNLMVSLSFLITDCLKDPDNSFFTFFK